MLQMLGQRNMDKWRNCPTWIYFVAFSFSIMKYINCFSTEQSTSATLAGTKTIQCLPNEYGDNCTYCMPKDTCIAGHYTCNYDTGNKVCLPGWSGKSCRIRTEPDMTFVSCPDNQCRNGGSCFSGQCCCVEGFTGILCEIEIIECTNTSCQNGGICKDLIGRYECLCKDQYTGDQCEIPPTPGHVQTTPHHDGGCQYNTCLNNGTCFEDAIFTYCLCPTWFTGPMCETSLIQQQTVSPNPCPKDHYGPSCNKVCVETDSCAGGHYICNTVTGDKVCMSGWIGDNCDTRLLPPPLDPYCPSGLGCKNDGQCDRGSCCCKHDHSGELCEIQSIGCVSSPCQHNGTCLEANGSFECVCDIGFSGRFCDIDLQMFSSSIAPTSTTSLVLSLPDSSAIHHSYVSTSSSLQSIITSYTSPNRFESSYNTSITMDNTFSVTDVSPSLSFLMTTATEDLRTSSGAGFHESMPTSITAFSRSSLGDSLETSNSEAKPVSSTADSFEVVSSTIKTFSLNTEGSLGVTNHNKTDFSFFETFTIETSTATFYKSSMLKNANQIITSMLPQTPFMTDHSTGRSAFYFSEPSSYSNSNSSSYYTESVSISISSLKPSSPYNFISIPTSFYYNLVSTSPSISFSDNFHFESSKLMTNVMDSSLEGELKASYVPSHQSLSYESFYTHIDSSNDTNVLSQVPLSTSESAATFPSSISFIQESSSVELISSTSTYSERLLSSFERSEIFSSPVSSSQEIGALTFSSSTNSVEIRPSFIINMHTASLTGGITETESIYSSKVIETHLTAPSTLLPSYESYSFFSQYSSSLGETNTQKTTSSILNYLQVSTLHKTFSIDSSQQIDNLGTDIFRETTSVLNINPTSVIYSSSDEIKTVVNSEIRILNFKNNTDIKSSSFSFKASEAVWTDTSLIQAGIVSTDTFKSISPSSSFSVESQSTTISFRTAIEPSTKIDHSLVISATGTFPPSSQYGNEASVIHGSRSPEVPSSEEESNTLVWWIILIIVIGVVVIGASFVIVALVVMRKRRSDFRAIEQNPEAVLAYDKEHFSFQPDIANPTFEPDDDSDDDSVKHDIYIVNR